MWVKSVEIVGVGGIECLNLNFDPSMNIICGPNGIGKTTVLECVAHAFSAGNTNILKKNARHETSSIAAVVNDSGQEHSASIKLKEFSPGKQDSVTGLHNLSSKLISLKINRTFDYVPLHAVGRDTEKSDHTSYSEARLGIVLSDVKNWFVNRYLYSKHETLTLAQMANYELARSSFSALNKDFVFSRVDAATNEILVNSPSGEIYYEYLSSGFKSCLSIIFGIIKEIEFRFSNLGVKAEDFDGVVLIDEIELHLHPEWQAIVLPVLAKRLPQVQFICSTHSPHVIQAAEARQIIAIESVGGVATQRELPQSAHGFKGWTVEEVLTDVMGMSDLRTPEYREAVALFERAVDSEDADKAREGYGVLEGMLHPESHLKKMLALQLASVRGIARD